MDVVLFGIGAPFAEVPSHVYSGGYLDESDLREPPALSSVVGDVATVFFREDGSTSDITLNERASGPDFARSARSSASRLRRRGPSKSRRPSAALSRPAS